MFERVNDEVPFEGMHWKIDHAETITPRSIERVGPLGGGIAIQHRMAYQGEYFVDRYGAKPAEQTPPVRRMLDMGVPVGAWTDATRVASYNPWVALYWLVTGRTVGGLRLSGTTPRLDRSTALRLWTEGSAWFSTEQGKKCRLTPGQVADLVALDRDYFSVAEEEIKSLAAVLTVVGRVVHGDREFKDLAPLLPPAMPDWSPVRVYGSRELRRAPACDRFSHTRPDSMRRRGRLLGALGCGCFAF